MHNYTAFHFIVRPAQPGVEILLAELGELGFESFVEEENGLKAYIHSEEVHSGLLDQVQLLHSPEFDISFTTEEIEPVNWNEEWEKNFQPIEVGGKCCIRAPFHEKSTCEFDLIIEPKMSFGTGHHATTHMMVQHILENDWQEKSVLDMGCGTGVLAILAEKKGAGNIDAIDIDNWCYQNTLENVERNQCEKINVYEGGAQLWNGKRYDRIIANINRNILLEDLPAYEKSLNPKGNL